jgi:hypothetical protein
VYRAFKDLQLFACYYIFVCVDFIIVIVDFYKMERVRLKKSVN